MVANRKTQGLPKRPGWKARFQVTRAGSYNSALVFMIRTACIGITLTSILKLSGATFYYRNNYDTITLRFTLVASSYENKGMVYSNSLPSLLLDHHFESRFTGGNVAEEQACISQDITVVCPVHIGLLRRNRAVCSYCNSLQSPFIAGIQLQIGVPLIS